MRILLIGLGVMVAALASGTRPSSAQYSGEWCIADGVHGAGSMDCSYHTFRQCYESRRGKGGVCMRNPYPERRERPNARRSRTPY
jgi:hypothetical protein